MFANGGRDCVPKLQVCPQILVDRAKCGCRERLHIGNNADESANLVRLAWKQNREWDEIRI